jgi:hypothetical protein
MVQSKGTRLDWQRFRIDFTGNRKYSGRCSDLRRLGAAGEIEARRAMPTSGATPLGTAPGSSSVAARAASFRKSCKSRSGSPQEAGVGGGQSALPLCRAMSGTMLPGPESGAGSWVRVFGLRSGPTGKREAEERGARRRIGKPAVDAEEGTGDIAHLETVRVFRFLFALSSCFAFCLSMPGGDNPKSRNAFRSTRAKL